MLFVIFIGTALILFGGFLLLTAYERRHARVFDAMRRKLDRVIFRLTFIVTHVDWSGFSKHMVRTSLERIAHDLAHGALQVVRFLERTLTRTVRFLRERRAGVITTHEDGAKRKTLRETVRGFRKSLVRKGKTTDSK